MAELYAELSRYCTRPGKRIRPLLVILGYLGYGGRSSKLSEIIRFAAAVELMHSMLLVQDDIIDQSPLRRGDASLHVLLADRYRQSSHNENLGSDLAMVLADVLFSNALEIIHSTRIGSRRRNLFMDIFARTYETTAFGQMLDSLNSLPRRMAPLNETPRLIGTMKTAYYTVYYPLLMGCALAGSYTSARDHALREFSLPLGLAFQVRDDILGVFGSETETGKPNDSDIREGKLTQLVQDAADALQGARRDRFIAAFTAARKSAGDVAFVREMIASSGALDRARGHHGMLIAQCEKSLDALGFRRSHAPVLRGVVDQVRAL
jgi:geranylgeranyl diphosphate synthase type I